MLLPTWLLLFRLQASWTKSLNVAASDEIPETSDLWRCVFTQDNSVTKATGLVERRYLPVTMFAFHDWQQFYNCWNHQVEMINYGNETLASDPKFHRRSNEKLLLYYNEVIWLWEHAYIFNQKSVFVQN